MKKIIVGVFALGVIFNLKAQVGIGTTSPDASSVLDITAVDKGVLVPRVSLTNVTNTITPVTTPATGLLVWNTNAGVTGGNGAGFYFFNGTQWMPVHQTASDDDRINNLADGKSDADGSQEGSSIFLGIDAGANDDSSDNKNIGIGYQALASVISGYENVAIGYQSLNSATIFPIRNVAIGYRSLFNSTQGANTAIGWRSLYQNDSGNGNTAIGLDAMLLNTTGNYNTAIGQEALYMNSSAQKNIAIGYRAMRSKTIGNENVSIGSESLFSNTIGVNNVVGGYRIFYNNINGSGNVALGYQAGYSSVSGSNNVFFGHQSGFSETGSNKLYIENSNSSTPLIYGEFDNDLLRINGTLDINNAYQFPAADGTSNQILQTDGAGNVSWVNNNPISLIPIYNNGSYVMGNTSGQDLTNMDTALEPTIYNASGNIEVKLVVRYSSIIGTNNLQLRAHNGTTQSYPIVNTDAWTFAGTQTGGVATSPWKSWNAGTNAYEIHVHGWSTLFSNITIVNAYLLVRSQ